MESNTPNPTQSNDNKQNNTSGKLKIIITVISIIAIFGVGFGIYGIIQSAQKDNQISSLNSQVSELQAEILLYEGNSSMPDKDAQNSEEEQSSEAAPRPGSGLYLEIPEWGVRFEYPDNIIEATYMFREFTLYFDCISYYPLTYFSNMAGETLTALGDGMIKYCATEDGTPGVQGAPALGELQRWDEIEAAQYKEKGITIGNLLNVGFGGETISEQDSVQYNLANPEPRTSAEHKLAWEQLRALLKNISYTQ